MRWQCWLLAGAVVLQAPPVWALCRGSVHYIVRDENGAILDAARLQRAIVSSEGFELQPLVLGAMPNALGAERRNVLRLGTCSFNGDLVLRLAERTMVLQFRNLPDTNDAALEVESLPFRAGVFRADFTGVNDPLVQSRIWLPVTPEDDGAGVVEQRERELDDAVRRRNPGALEDLLADDGVFVVGTRRLDKREFIELLVSARPGEKSTLARAVSDLELLLGQADLLPRGASPHHLRFIGAAALVDGGQTFSLPVAAGTRSYTRVYTRVWAPPGQARPHAAASPRWQLVSQHLSGEALEPPRPAAPPRR